MKYFLLLLFTVFSDKTLHAQIEENPLPYVMPEQIYDTAPQFPGGSNAMQKFFADSIRYPEAEKNKNKQGYVSAKFTVSADGIITAVKILNGVPYAPGLAFEAERLIWSMPPWIPASKNKHPVEAEYYLSIPFYLKKL